MSWKIEYANRDVEQFILKLPSGLAAKYFRLTDLMQEFGSNLGMPHSRALTGGLFELRVKGQEGIARFFLLHIGRAPNYDASLLRKEIAKNSGQRIETCPASYGRG